jgi:DNA invertase Pin-like site-specific DNA recombinase
MKTMAKEYGYGRVSTTHQNTDRQIEALLEYGIAERDIIIDQQSGKDFNRKGYLTLKENMLRSGDTLVVKELDRLGRNKRMIKEELEYFKTHGIRVKILNVPTTLIDCEGQDWVMEMVSNILIEVMASIAEEERVKNHQRQSEGIAIAKAKGVEFGRPKIRKPDGYDEVMQRVAVGEIKAVEAMKLLGVKKTSFYKLKKMFPIIKEV